MEVQVLACIFTPLRMSPSKPVFSPNAILPHVINTKASKAHFENTLWHKRTLSCIKQENCVSFDDGFKNQFVHVWRLKDKFSSLLLMSFVECLANWSKAKKGDFRHEIVSYIGVRLVGGLMLVTLSSVALSSSPSWALNEENLLFLEAWRTIDRAYVDRSFNGQNWLQYRENALHNEPMNNREETYMAIRKMLSSLDDTFTRFLEPEKFKSLRSGTQNSLTGVGLSIGYPTKYEVSPAGLVVISAAPGGPANRAGVLPGDIILEIDDMNTETMSIYDASELLQRQKVLLNPVKSRICVLPGSGKDYFKIGYIKLTTFNRNASRAVKEAIDTLKNNNVNAFVLDLRDNSGGLFPEGIKIARLWLDKGVIAYVYDSRGVRDIYDTDASSAIAVSEPLAVLVNKGTASASEILAGALKDNKRAIMLGEPTFGKGKVQSVFQLSDGSGLAVTVARYETPAHIDIDKVGINPDYPLEESFPKDVESICNCLEDPESSCYLDKEQLLSR